MQTIHSCPTALVSQPTPSTYQVLPTPPAPYAVAYVAEAAAPDLTLASVRAALLPLAQACGFEDVAISNALNQNGNNYSLYAQHSAAQKYACLTLAPDIHKKDLPELLAIAHQTLLDLLETINSK